MKTDYVVRTLDSSEWPQWNQFVQSSSTGCIYATTDYLKILCDATGGNFSVQTVWRGTELQAGAALYTENRNGKRFTANRLLLYYHPVIVREFSSHYPSERTSKQLAALTPLAAFLETDRSDRLVLHVRHTLNDLRPFLCGTWRVRPSYSYLIDFSSPDAAWKRIEQNQRRLIDRASEHGMTVSDDDDFDSFFRLHLQTHERKGAPLYLPKEQFRVFVSQLREKRLGRLLHARLPGGSAAASQLVLHDNHPVTHTVCAAADHESLRLGSTPFLRWQACLRLAADGYQATDLTDAALNDVTRFKSQLGASLVCNSVITRPDSVRLQRSELFGRILGALRRKLGRA